MPPGIHVLPEPPEPGPLDLSAYLAAMSVICVLAFLADRHADRSYRAERARSVLLVVLVLLVGIPVGGVVLYVLAYVLACSTTGCSV